MIIDGSRPRLPFAEELSPGVVRLSTVLDIFGDHAGDRAAILEALVKPISLKRRRNARTPLTVSSSSERVPTM